MPSRSLRRQTGTIRQIPSPIGGLNARDSVADMPATDAITLDNVFPERSYVRLRSGYASHATGITGPTETLMTWDTLAPKMLAVAGGSVFDASAPGAVGAAIKTGLSNSRLQNVMFSNTGGQYLVSVNGADGVMTYDGTAWATQAITQAGVPLAAAASFICVTSWKKRLWFGLAGTTKVYYLGTDAIAGDAVLLNLGGVWRLGGNISSIISTSFDSAGTGVAEYIGFVSTLGEIALYAGTDPASPDTFALVGVFRLGLPVGRRYWAQMGGDIALVTSLGVVSLTQQIQIDRSATARFAITDKISSVFAAAYDEFSSSFGWDIQIYPRGHMLIINIPQAGQPSVQFVMNTLSGAWCRFTGHDALTWCLFNEEAYFAGSAGTVYKADTGGNDAGAAIPYVARSAFHDYGTQLQKRFTMIRPLIMSNGPPNPSMAMDVDYGAQNVTNIPLTVSSDSVWDVAVWDVALWSGGTQTYRPFVTVGGIGNVGSIRMAGNAKNLEMQVSAYYVYFEPASRLST